MKIDKDIPIPTSRGKNAEILMKMKIGESIFSDDGTTATSKIYRSAKQMAYLKKNIRFSGRNEKNGVRIWRIE